MRAVKLSMKKVKTNDFSWSHVYEKKWVYSCLSQGNPTIFIESNIHAREWASVATSTYILNELLTSSDPQIKEMAENYDWVFVPVVNVDGYEYTHTSVNTPSQSIYSEFSKI